MACNFRPVTHVIFDMDGLMLDTERLYTEATQSVLDKYDKTYTWEVKMMVMGQKNTEVAKVIVKEFDLPITPEEFGKLQRAATMKLMPTANLMPDTEKVYEEIIRQIANKYDKEYNQDVRVKLLGTTEQRTAEIAVEGIGLPITPKSFLEQFHALCREKLAECEMMQGAERLVRHLYKHNIPFALATSSSEEMVNIKITKHKEVFNLFHHMVCGSSDPEVKIGKPAPDIFLVAASRFSCIPDSEKCLVFEDAPNGVTAANSAGMQVIMVPDERVPDELRQTATKVLKSLEEFKPEEFGLPPFPELE